MLINQQALVNVSLSSHLKNEKISNLSTFTNFCVFRYSISMVYCFCLSPVVVLVAEEINYETIKKQRDSKRQKKSNQ
jgi:hypothetical protein